MSPQLFPVPFSINVPEERLRDLRTRLELAQFPDELPGAVWDYGVPLDDLRRLVKYWKDSFDWKKQEEHLNASLPQFIIDIDVDKFGPLNIHFIHQKSEVRNAVPLLFIHGWPGSFIESAKLIPLLAKPENPENPAFHVVAVSLPGFTFSEAPKKRGFANAQQAEVGHKLMLALGYNQYVVQGGDWGSVITSEVALRFGGDHCKAIHINMIVAQPPKLTKNPLLWLRNTLTPYTLEEREGLKRTKWFTTEGNGYFREQSTQPQTLAYSLTDSPVGLLAWIYEKMVNWTDGFPWTDDEILTWVSLYWYSRSGPGTSVRIYYEYEHSPYYRGNQVPIPVHNTLIGMSQFPRDIFVTPALWAKTFGKVVFQTRHTQGGHFAATETPKLLAGDLYKMFGKNGPAYGAVPGATGYHD